MKNNCARIFKSETVFRFLFSYETTAFLIAQHYIIIVITGKKILHCRNTSISQHFLHFLISMEQVNFNLSQTSGRCKRLCQLLKKNNGDLKKMMKSKFWV